MENFDPPTPEAIAIVSDHMHYLSNALRDLDQLTEVALGDPKSFYRVAVQGLAEIISATNDAARELAVKGVQEHAITRINVGATLGVHPNTVARWVKAATAAEVQIPEQGSGTGRHPDTGVSIHGHRQASRQTPTGRLRRP